MSNSPVALRHSPPTSLATYARGNHSRCWHVDVSLTQILTTVNAVARRSNQLPCAQGCRGCPHDPLRATSRSRAAHQGQGRDSLRMDGATFTRSESALLVLGH